MQALAEPEVARGGPERVVLLGALELPLVLVGGADDDGDPGALGDRDAVQLDVPGGGADGQLERGAEAEALLDRGGDQARVVAQRALEVRAGAELLEERRDQRGGRLDAGEVQPEHEADDLRGGHDVLLGERHPGDVRLHDVGEQVPARTPAPLLQESGEVVPGAVGAVDGVRGELVVVGHAVLEAVRPRDELGALLAVGQAQEVEEHLVGQRPGQLLGDVGGAPAREGVDEAGGDAAYVVLQRGDAAGHELALHDRAQLVVTGVVDVRQVALAALVVGRVEVDAGVVDERHRVEQGRAAVLEARQRPEAPLLVVVDRRLLAQATVDRERVVLERVRERVVDEGGGRSTDTRAPGPTAGDRAGRRGEHVRKRCRRRGSARARGRSRRWRRPPSPDDAVVAGVGEGTGRERPVDLARARLAAAGLRRRPAPRRGTARRRAPARSEVALADLGVVEVEVQPQMGACPPRGPAPACSAARAKARAGVVDRGVRGSPARRSRRDARRARRRGRACVVPASHVSPVTTSIGTSGRPPSPSPVPCRLSGGQPDVAWASGDRLLGGPAAARRQRPAGTRSPRR